ncbi:hypothetical protein BT69DRAFT_1278664 [Atractiella rhizophila]|nr:hypothetical protein BT69DRAFT_1278664 [Atractiella rhizophila]
MSYAEHARGSGSTLTREDVLLAIQYRNEGSSTGTRGGSSKELLLSLANTVNSLPLPQPSSSTRLPPPRDRLTNPNFEIVPVIKPGEKRKRAASEAGAEEAEGMDGVDGAGVSEAEGGNVGGRDEDEEMEMDEVLPAGEGGGERRELVEDDDYD